MGLFQYRTRDSLIAHGKRIAEPVNTYYTNLFTRGDNQCLRELASACKIFYPFFLKGKQDRIHEVLYYVPKLAVFGDNIFTDDFLNNLTAEVPIAIEEANKHVDWGMICQSKGFQTRMQKRLKKQNAVDDNNNNNRANSTDIDVILKDPSLKAQCIWEWWRVRLLDSTQKFLYFKTALRKVVLCQTSSCAVERVFSRLKFIKELVGNDTSYEDMTQLRVFMQCNGDLDDLANELNNAHH